MPETPKEKREIKDAVCDETKNPGDLWEADQAERSYYYDDAHGYEVYDSDNDEEDGEEEAKVRSE
ncbi:MAG: hypothetical protein WBD27_06445 [Pyrinomonadaceae bacterium]